MKIVRRKKSIRSRAAVQTRAGRSQRTGPSARRASSTRTGGSRFQGRYSPVRKVLNKKRVASKFEHGLDPRTLLTTAVKEFESGMLMFQKQNFERAREIFEKLVEKGPVEVGSRAGSYLKVCEQKLGAAAPATRSAREYYDVGIAQLNARHLDAALESLARADKLAPRQEYIRYALAAACAQHGNVDAALGHLTAAIELRPANRSLAAQDEDFQPLVSDSRFQKLIRSGGM
jgi:tetratricopeptide (TPR) repeat protein